MEASSGTLSCFLDGGINANTTVVAQGYWTSFIQSYNPNTYKYANAAIWQAYYKSQRQRIVFEVGGRTLMQNITKTVKDRCDYFNTIAS
ncbi:unnamed protein product [Fusarium graminearum]|nr:unnamed protein product [Fusarium graminearum]VTO88398.1 unnamed protein product [Fusarium graminearum]